MTTRWRLSWVVSYQYNSYFYLVKIAKNTYHEISDVTKTPANDFFQISIIKLKKGTDHKTEPQMDLK